MSDPPAKMLEAIGLVAVRWAGVETIIEITCTYLLKYLTLKGIAQTPPLAFSQRIKFIRRSLNDPLFIHLRDEFFVDLDKALILSRRRNDIMHGAFIKWSEGKFGDQLIIRASKEGHTVEANSLSVQALGSLALNMQSAFSDHFNLQDRLKAVIRGFEGKSDIGRRAKFGKQRSTDR